jgi:modulator of FtsH protease HflK
MRRLRAALLPVVGRCGLRPVLALAGVVAYLASGFYTVPATSLAVTRVFGVIADPRVPPGVHWWWPRPIGRVDRAEVTRTFTMPVGYLAIEDARGIRPDPSVADWLTGDTNILQLRARVNYRIGDPAEYLYASAQPAEILRYVAGSAFTEAASALPVDDLLTSGRLALIERVQARTQEVLDRWGVGLQVLTVNLESVEPPSLVMAAFQDVQNARADRERLISEAEAYANGLVPVARGEAERSVNEALTFRDQRLNRARGDAERFTTLAAEHRRAPDLLERRLYLETAERVLPRVRRYVLGPGGDGALPIRIIE